MLPGFALLAMVPALTSCSVVEYGYDKVAELLDFGSAMPAQSAATEPAPVVVEVPLFDGERAGRSEKPAATASGHSVIWRLEQPLRAEPAEAPAWHEALPPAVVPQPAEDEPAIADRSSDTAAAEAPATAISEPAEPQQQAAIAGDGAAARADASDVDALLEETRARLAATRARQPALDSLAAPARKPVQPVSIEFAPLVEQLSSRDKVRLTSFFQALPETARVRVRAFVDAHPGAGGSAPIAPLRRSTNIRDYLATLGLPKEQITVTMVAADSGTTDASPDRVEVAYEARADTQGPAVVPSALPGLSENGRETPRAGDGLAALMRRVRHYASLALPLAEAPAPAWSGPLPPADEPQLRAAVPPPMPGLPRDPRSDLQMVSLPSAQIRGSTGSRGPTDYLERVEPEPLDSW